MKVKELVLEDSEGEQINMSEVDPDDLQEANQQAEANDKALVPGIKIDGPEEKAEKKYFFKVFSDYKTHRLKYYMQEYKELA